MSEAVVDSRDAGPIRRHKGTMAAVVVVVVVVVVFLVATASTGFPGPGPLRRYPRSDLDALALKINAQPTVWVRDCSGGHFSDPGAHVNLLLSRVVLDGGITEMITAEEQAMLTRPAFMPASPECA